MSEKLTADERAMFTAAQLTQIKRLTKARRDEMLDAPEGTGLSDADYRAKILRSIARLPADQLRARVNILTVRGGVVDYADMSNYTARQKNKIALAVRDGYSGGWQKAVARALE